MGSGENSMCAGLSVDGPSGHGHAIQCPLCLLTERQERQAGVRGGFGMPHLHPVYRTWSSPFFTLRSPPSPCRTVRQHERNRDSRNCASNPGHTGPHQSSCRCDQECALPHRFAAETILNSHLRLRTSLKASRSS